MNENKPATGHRVIGSDLARVDTHVITPAEYDEIPELTDADMARADHHLGGKLVRRGRPKSDAPKIAVNLRLDRDVLEHFKANGPGWQSRVNEALRKAAGV